MLYTNIPAKIRAFLSLWTGFTLGADNTTVLDLKLQKFFVKWEIEALFTGEGSAKKNKWLVEVNDMKVNLLAVLAAGVRFEIDCGGTRPKGVHLVWDMQQRKPTADSPLVDFVAFEDAVERLGVKHLVEVAEGVERRRDEEGQVGKEKEPAETEGEAEVVSELKKLRGESEVGYLRVWGPGPPVVPSKDSMEEALGKVSGLDGPYDLEKGGVDMVVFFARPRNKKMEVEPGQQGSLRWVMDEGLVRGMTARMAELMTEGSVAVIVAPPIMPKEWIVGLKPEPYSTWSFSLCDKVSDDDITRSIQVFMICDCSASPVGRHKTDQSKAFL